MKKRFSVIFILMSFMIIMAFFVKPKTAFAYSKQSEGLNVQSQSVYLIDAYSGTTIYAKNEEQRLPIASMCKIMTTLLSFEAIDNGFMNLDDLIIVSENASKMGGSQVFLEQNASYPVRDLIKSVIVASANDASVALAEHIAGSEKAFVDMMNEKANDLGMDNTLFANATGLPKETQYSCAKDVSKMFTELLKHEDYFTFSTIWMDEIHHPKGRVTEIANTNKLVKFYDGCDGGKTGYTSQAGHCVCASAIRDGMRLVSVVIKAPDSKTRFKDASDMLNYGFNNFTNKLVVDKDKSLTETVKVIGGKVDNIEIKPKDSIYLFSAKNQKIGVEIVVETEKSVKAPIKYGDVIGKLSVYDANGVEIKSVDLISSVDVERAGYFDSIKKITENWAV